MTALAHLALSQELQRLKTENLRLEISLEAARHHAISQDCGRMCDNDSGLMFMEQWERSERHVDWVIRFALALGGVAAENVVASESVL